MMAALRALPPFFLPAAAAFAVAELLAAIALGGFFHGLRAEPLLFLAFRPWLLLVAVAGVSSHAIRVRSLFYIVALGTAAASETVFLLMLGAQNPWPMTLRGLGAGFVLIAILDPIFMLAKRFGGLGVFAAVAASAALFLSPWGLVPYDRIAVPREAAKAHQDRPHLMVMTGLPIVWGEKGAFDPQSRPAGAYRLLQQDFTVRLLDSLDADALAHGSLLLLAQPRALAPAELVALDSWVRAGGRVLILSDPALVWRSSLPIGDLRRPPPVALLGPLLSHWDLSVQLPDDSRLVAQDLETGRHKRRLMLAAPGQIEVRGKKCELAQPWLAQCAIGDGRAVILSDADLLNDALWAAPPPDGVDRNLRRSDNGIVISELLDGLAEHDRDGGRAGVDWLPLDLRAEPAVGVALLPILLVVAAGLVVRRRRD